MTYRQSHAAKLAVVAFGAALLSSAGAARAASVAAFDGNWSVLIVTESGSCDRSYRYGVNIENGAVRYRGESGVDVRGSVDNRGHVHVAIGRGDQRAEGTGQLGQDSGSGVWTGTSPSSHCQGRWEAERR